MKSANRTILIAGMGTSPAVLSANFSSALSFILSI